MTTPNEELINNLTIKAGVMEMGERIAWGSDTALMRQAAATLQSQAERIADLERESETHAKAYGLAIVERDNLRYELKVAQEGWRCECSTDDACRFARERDALRVQLAAIAAYKEQVDAHEAAITNAEPAGWQPIETAPKDGSFYLAFGEGKTWTQNQPNGCYPGEWYFSESRGEWRGYSLTDESTHWMPLPTQPKDAP